jgi:hypothetical protein
MSATVSVNATAWCSWPRVTRQRQCRRRRRRRSISADRHGRRICQERQADARNLLRGSRGPAADAGLDEQPAATEADCDRRRDGQADVSHRFHGPAPPAPAFNRDDGQRQCHEGRRDAVVKATLNVEPAANADGNGLIGDDRQPEGRIGRREDAGDQGGGRPRGIGEQQLGYHRARNHRQREADTQQATRQTKVGADGSERDRRRVRKQQHGQGELGQQ